MKASGGSGNALPSLQLAMDWLKTAAIEATELFYPAF
tara:strand:- start:6 stop:116 length:111 start_codon:yes stop_codon:yes gene_type:complete